MKILLIHPEGGLNYNVNLLGIIELLYEAGHHVTYLAPCRPKINQFSPLKGVKVVLLDTRQHEGQFIFNQAVGRNKAGIESSLNQWEGYDLILAVDRGIIEGAKIARQFSIPHALISYELFFKEETTRKFKLPEIEACSDLSFATAPDSTRSRLLCLVNDIHPDKILEVPVAGRGFQASASKPRLIHQTFQLTNELKTVLYMGSLSEWSGDQFLLNSTWEWPEDWILIIHERFGPTKATLERIRQLGNPDRIRISPTPFMFPQQMSEFIQSADLGVALYQPTYETAWVGKNIKYIGLSSGKITTYLQHGVPVATHELGEISDLIHRFGAGQIFPLDRPFIPEQPSPESIKACEPLFEMHLDLNRFGKSFIDAVTNAKRIN